MQEIIDEKIKKERLRKELKNQIYPVSLAGNTFHKWRHWALYQKIEFSRDAADLLSLEIKKKINNIQYICPIPTSGFILATLISERLNLPILNTRFREGILANELLPRSYNTLLIDTSIDTGNSLVQILFTLDKYKTDVLGLVTILYNDEISNEYTFPTKKSWRDSGKLVYLFTMNDLLA